jgi:replication factor C subunit 2/4
MEIYSSTTRFALACNQSTKIIEPIQSRCAVVRYSKISDGDILKRLLVVCEREQVAHNDEGLEAIIFTADGDMRQSLNNLQVGFARTLADASCILAPPVVIRAIASHSPCSQGPHRRLVRIS